MDSRLMHQKLTTTGTVLKEVAAKIFRGSEPKLIPWNISTKKAIAKDTRKSHTRCILGSIVIIGAAVLIFWILGLAIGYRNPYSLFTQYRCGVIDDIDLDEVDYDFGNDIHILTRSQWGGRDILESYRNRTLDYPIKLVIIGHTASHQCMTVEDCSLRLQAIQDYHVSDLNCVDIKYNFLIGGDGNIYQALGWDIQNYLRNDSIQIQFIGNYGFDEVLARQRVAVEALLNRGLELGKLDENYLIVAHNQVANTESPGRNLFTEIKNWPHYHSGSLPKNMQL